MSHQLWLYFSWPQPGHQHIRSAQWDAQFSRTKTDACQGSRIVSSESCQKIDGRRGFLKKCTTFKRVLGEVTDQVRGSVLKQLNSEPFIFQKRTLILVILARTCNFYRTEPWTSQDPDSSFTYCLNNVRFWNKNSKFGFGSEFFKFSEGFIHSLNLEPALKNSHHFFLCLSFWIINATLVVLESTNTA